MVKKTMAASQFKAECLRIMDEVARRRITVVVTKRGRPVARILPPESERSGSLFGFGRGYIRATGDVVSPTGAHWEALAG